jgi:hypothetical protein
MYPRVPSLLLLAATVVVSGGARAQEGSVGIFVRSDTDDTTVISPRLAIASRLGDEERTRVDVAYTADIWTSASVDIRTAATKPITEQRDQIEGGVSHEMDETTLGGGYYFSGENDYISHGGSLSAIQEVAGGAATLEGRASVGYDVAGRSGDPVFAESMWSVGGRFVYTQITDPMTLIQTAYEVTHREGYQSSPYRFVGMGGDGQCGGTASFCVPETHPNLRTRHAMVGRIRHAFSRDTSAGIGYRFYIDDWGVVAHTAASQIAYLPSDESALSLRYRFYLQSQANFYRSNYPLPGAEVRFVTRDRELSPMFSNRVALSYESRFLLGSGAALRVAVAIGGTVFVYRDFVGLDEVYAGDGTVALTLEL